MKPFRVTSHAVQFIHFKGSLKININDLYMIKRGAVLCAFSCISQSFANDSENDIYDCWRVTATGAHAHRTRVTSSNY